jgi:hypothetical protein
MHKALVNSLVAPSLSGTFGECCQKIANPPSVPVPVQPPVTAPVQPNTVPPVPNVMSPPVQVQVPVPIISVPESTPVSDTLPVEPVTTDGQQPANATTDSDI